MMRRKTKILTLHKSKWLDFGIGSRVCTLYPEKLNLFRIALKPLLLWLTLWLRKSHCLMVEHMLYIYRRFQAQASRVDSAGLETISCSAQNKAKLYQKVASIPPDPQMNKISWCDHLYRTFLSRPSSKKVRAANTVPSPRCVLPRTLWGRLGGSWLMKRCRTTTEKSS